MARASLAVEALEAEGAIRVGRAVGASRGSVGSRGSGGACTGGSCTSAEAVEQESKRGSSQGGCRAGREAAQLETKRVEAVAAAEAVAKTEGCAAAALLKAEGVWFRVEPGPEEEGHGRGPAWIGS